MAFLLDRAWLIRMLQVIAVLHILSVFDNVIYFIWRIPHISPGSCSWPAMSPDTSREKENQTPQLEEILTVFFQSAYLEG